MIRSIRCKVLALSLVMFTLGCQTMSKFEPARWVSPEAQGLSELREVLAQTTGVENVRLGTSAFADTHILVLQPGGSNLPNARIATGRLTGKPHTFHLLSDGQRCVLEYANDGRRFELDNVQCQRFLVDE